MSAEAQARVKELIDARIADGEPVGADMVLVMKALLGTPLASGPQLAEDLPAALAVQGDMGKSARAAREDHTHAARVQRQIVTLDSRGLATWTFGKPFSAMPSLQALVFQPSGEPVVVEARAWIMDGARFAGVQVQGMRSRPLPQINLVSGLLAAVITGVNTLVSALSGFRVFNTEGLSGVQVHLSAGDVM